MAETRKETLYEQIGRQMGETIAHGVEEEWKARYERMLGVSWPDEECGE